MEPVGAFAALYVLMLRISKTIYMCAIAQCVESGMVARQWLLPSARFPLKETKTFDATPHRIGQNVGFVNNVEAISSIS
jgi:hypothetical protein